MIAAKQELTPAEIRSDVRLMPRWVMPAVTAAIFCADAAITAAAFILAFRVRHGEAIFAGGGWSKAFAPYAGVAAFSVVATVVMLVYQRAYRFFGAFSFTHEAGKVFYAVVFSSLLTVAWAFLFRGFFEYQQFSYSRSVFLIDFAFLLVGLTAFHWMLRAAQVRFRKRGINLIPTIVVGTNAEAEKTILELEQQRHLGYRIFGAVASSEGEHADLGVSVLGSLDGLAGVIREHGIQEVIITDNNIESARLFDVMMSVGRRQKVEFRFAPGILDLLPQKTSVDQIGVLPMVRLFREPLSDTQRFIKRVSDIAIAAVAAVVTAPFWLAAAIAIKADSKGPVFFRQERVGMDGRKFLCFKFRTMNADADEAVHREAYEKNIEGQAAANAGDEDHPIFGKVKDDPRITRVGTFLRRVSLDELPQLLNVLRGEMSIVGPRPPIPYEVERYELWHRKRLDMKPGMTGLWQVSGRNKLTFDEMVRADIYYIENWSLMLDLRIIVLTLPAMFRGDGV